MVGCSNRAEPAMQHVQSCFIWDKLSFPEKQPRCFMLEYPETYEEAKRLVRDSLDSDVVQRSRRIQVIRMVVITGVALCATVALARIMEDPASAAIIVAFPFFFAMFAELFPFLLTLRSRSQIRDGSYFEGRPAEEIFAMAHRYVNAYNEYERKRNGGKK